VPLVILDRVVQLLMRLVGEASRAFANCRQAANYRVSSS